MSITRTLEITNESLMNGKFCLFATKPDTNTPDSGMSVCMLSQRVSTQPGTRTSFTWQEEISAMWSTSRVEPRGLIESMGTQKGMNFKNRNAVSLSHEQGAFAFKNVHAQDYSMKPSQGEGMIFIEQDGSVPKAEGSVGIAIGGRGAFVLPTQPNMTYNFTPHLKYWVTFADYMPGEIVDISEHNNDIYEFEFGANVGLKEVTFNINNQFVE